FPPAKGRYVVYAAAGCPWAARVVTLLALKQLDTDAIRVIYVAPEISSQGWIFDAAHPDPLYGAPTLRALYDRSLQRQTGDASARHAGKVTVPVLWDTTTEQIVNNESGDIIRMLDGFEPWAGRRGLDLYPAAHRAAIDEACAYYLTHLNQAVAQAGSATSQDAYAAAVGKVHAAMDRAEATLAQSPWLLGDRFTEVDLRVYVTLIRNDPVFMTLWRVQRSIAWQYPHLLRFVRRIFQQPGVAATWRVDEVKRFFYLRDAAANPHRIVPLWNGPDLSVPVEMAPLIPEESS
ncbi:hypothetical protein CXG81DRAFT_13494, partial [Caulochytrium protostelioides]